MCLKTRRSLSRIFQHTHTTLARFPKRNGQGGWKVSPKKYFFSFVDIKKQEVEDGGRVVGSSLCVVKEDFFFRPLTFCLFYLPDDQYYNSVWGKKSKSRPSAMSSIHRLIRKNNMEFWKKYDKSGDEKLGDENKICHHQFHLQIFHPKSSSLAFSSPKFTSPILHLLI